MSYRLACLLRRLILIYEGCGGVRTTFLPAAPVPRDGRSCPSGGPVEDDPEVFGGRVMHANEADLSVLFFLAKCLVHDVNGRWLLVHSSRERAQMGMDKGFVPGARVSTKLIRVLIWVSNEKLSRWVRSRGREGESVSFGGGQVFLFHCMSVSWLCTTSLAWRGSRFFFFF